MINFPEFTLTKEIIFSIIIGVYILSFIFALKMTYEYGRRKERLRIKKIINNQIKENRKNE